MSGQSEEVCLGDPNCDDPGGPDCVCPPPQQPKAYRPREDKRIALAKVLAKQASDLIRAGERLRAEAKRLRVEVSVERNETAGAGAESLTTALSSPGAAVPYRERVS